MQRIDAVQHNAGRAGAGEGRGNLLADVARFADTDHDNLAALTKGFDNEFHRVIESLVQVRAHGFDPL